MAILVTWSMACQTLSTPEIKRIKLVYLLSLVGISFLALPYEQVSKLGTLDTVFRLDCFYSFFFYFLLILLGSLLNRMIGNRLMETVSWIGKISFSLYLIHFPLFKLFGYLHREIFEEKPANFLISSYIYSR